MTKIDPDRLHIAFHNGKGRSGKNGFYAWAIKKIAGAPVHCELLFPEWVVSDEKTSFSSASEDKGVRFKQIDYAKHPDRWTLYEMPFGYHDIARIYYHAAAIYDKCKDMRNSYDYKGVVCKQWWGWKNERLDKWYCSEVCTRSLMIVMNIFNTDDLTPAELEHKIKDYLRSQTGGLITKPAGKLPKIVKMMKN